MKGYQDTGRAPTTFTSGDTVLCFEETTQSAEEGNLEAL
jgi:hypothetical protein